MDGLDGAALRQLREKAHVSQATVAREAGVSVGHISRVETGSRAVSPAVVTGYESALKVRLRGAAVPHREPDGARLASYGTGEEADTMKRRAFTAAVAAIAAGGPLGEPVSRAVAALGSATIPHRVGLPDVVQVEQAADMFTTWDLRFGGGLAREMARTQLRWAVGLLPAHMSQPVRDRLNSAVGSLAERAAWSTFDAGEQDGARTLFKLALYAATDADDSDLRAHILSDVATQQLYLGSPHECLKIIRMAEGDDRVSPAVRFALHGVKARAFGALADADGTRQQIGLAEDAYADVTPETTPEWMTRFLNDAHVDSVTGQAAYSLAAATGAFSDDAGERLSRAVRGFTGGRARAVALCATRLAALHFRAGHLAEADRASRVALAAVPGLRSARITRDLRSMRAAAARHPGAGAVTADIDQAIACAA
ncbi:helix-turn-helix domain-containing protein [Krasilnikovia cinnamomea]|uniref:helix-turn-helix domain-containing protein n=1 Tax=Krasilnikovia cinnamomea TaxID=349313 RepID=UPI0013EEFD97|nr:helix-turn-helix transcriptional regulator [Krasilnikovia cinnamomea]